MQRLIDLPGVDALELQAIMKRDFAEPEARAEHPEIDACSLAIFGITAAQAEETPRPADWDFPENKPVAQQVMLLEDAGWDLTDNKRKPLRNFAHFNQQLWLALRGVAGTLPFVPEDDTPSPGASALAAEAARFRKR